MIEYYYKIPVGSHFHVENDDGTYNLCFKVLDAQGLEAYIILKENVLMEYASGTMLVIK